MIESNEYTREERERLVVDTDARDDEVRMKRIAAARALYLAGLTRYYWPNSTGSHGIVARITKKSDLGKFSRLVREAIPGTKRSGPPEVWSPYAEVAMVSWPYLTPDGVRISVWLETTINEIPPGILSPGCHFEPVKHEQYAVVCPVKEAIQ